MPAWSLDLSGVAWYEVFLRGTLDKIGAYPDFLHIGEYKTAANTMTAQGEVTVRWAYAIAAPALIGAVALAVLIATG